VQIFNGDLLGGACEDQYSSRWCRDGYGLDKEVNEQQSRRCCSLSCFGRLRSVDDEVARMSY
jgi:hypothetical protein